MDRILIRPNTSPQDRPWIILINNQQSLAHKVCIRIPCETIMEEVAGMPKYHILCYGRVYWPEPNMAVIDV
jgi:hypothetical protein